MVYCSVRVIKILKIDKSSLIDGSKFGVDEWHFIRWKVRNLVHDTFWVVVDLGESIIVDYRWTDIQQKWCVGSVVSNLAFPARLTK